MADLQTHRAYSRIKAYGHAYGMPWPMRRTFLHYFLLFHFCRL